MTTVRMYNEMGQKKLILYSHSVNHRLYRENRDRADNVDDGGMGTIVYSNVFRNI